MLKEVNEKVITRGKKRCFIFNGMIGNWQITKNKLQKILLEKIPQINMMKTIKYQKLQKKVKNTDMNEQKKSKI